MRTTHKKEFLQVCMDSPLYFTMPLPMRLDFLKIPEQRLSQNNLRELLLNWVKTGLLEP